VKEKGGCKIMAGESRGMQIFFMILCVTIAANFVHATGLFNTSTYSTFDSNTMLVQTIGSGNNGVGDILNSIAYGGGGGMWIIINLIVNMGAPVFMIYDMLGMSLIAAAIGVVFNLLYWFFMFIAGTEILTGRVILQ
jgi:hypothetical protein